MHQRVLITCVDYELRISEFSSSQKYQNMLIFLLADLLHANHCQTLFIIKSNLISPCIQYLTTLKPHLLLSIVHSFIERYVSFSSIYLILLSLQVFLTYTDFRAIILDPYS